MFKFISEFNVNILILFRQNLFTAWKHQLDMANIAYRAELARTEFLSDPDKRLQWQSHSLPTDDLCTENAIMLSRYIFFSFLKILKNTLPY